MTAITHSTAVAPAPPATAGEPLSEVERLFRKLAALRIQNQNHPAWTSTDIDAALKELGKLDNEMQAILDQMATVPSESLSDVARKVEAWALQMLVLPNKCKERKPSDWDPEAHEIVASFLEDAERLAPMFGAKYPGTH